MVGGPGSAGAKALTAPWLSQEAWKCWVYRVACMGDPMRPLEHSAQLHTRTGHQQNANNLYKPGTTATASAGKPRAEITDHCSSVSLYPRMLRSQRQRLQQAKHRIMADFLCKAAYGWVTNKPASSELQSFEKHKPRFQRRLHAPAQCALRSKGAAGGHRSRESASVRKEEHQ